MSLKVPKPSKTALQSLLQMSDVGTATDIHRGYFSSMTCLEVSAKDGTINGSLPTEFRTSFFAWWPGRSPQQSELVRADYFFCAAKWFVWQVLGAIMFLFAPHTNSQRFAYKQAVHQLSCPGPLWFWWSLITLSLCVSPESGITVLLWRWKVKRKGRALKLRMIRMFGQMRCASLVTSVLVRRDFQKQNGKTSWHQWLDHSANWKTWKPPSPTQESGQMLRITQCPCLTWFTAMLPMLYWLCYAAGWFGRGGRWLLLGFNAWERARTPKLQNAVHPCPILRMVRIGVTIPREPRLNFYGYYRILLKYVKSC